MKNGEFVKIKSGPYTNHVGRVLDDIGPAVHVLVMGVLKVAFAHHQLTVVSGEKCCETCANGEFWFDGGDREQPPDQGFECKKFEELDDKTFMFFESAHWDSCTCGENCPFYELITAECAVCGKNLGPAHQVGLYAYDRYVGEPVPVCSQKCRKEFEDGN